MPILKAIESLWSIPHIVHQSVERQINEWAAVRRTRLLESVRLSRPLRLSCIVDCTLPIEREAGSQAILHRDRRHVEAVEVCDASLRDNAILVARLRSNLHGCLFRGLVQRKVLDSLTNHGFLTSEACSSTIKERVWRLSLDIQLESSIKSQGYTSINDR